MYLLFIVGLVLLIYGGDWFVDGATGIARRFHLPELLIGATVVSIGTTLPEVMVSTTSAIQGHSQIAYGNAIGSIICNTALIAAISAAVRPSAVNKKTLRTPVTFFFIAAAFYVAVAYTSGYFSRPIGVILLMIFVLYMIANVMGMKNEPAGSVAASTTNNGNPDQHHDAKSDDPENGKAAAAESEDSPVWKMILLLVVGAALIAIGADLLVDNGTLIAQALGVPESVIALTFVALGTSLPELVTAITSLIKGHSSLSLGNVIGANVFNLVLVCGLSITVSPFSIPENSTLFGINASLVVDLPVMLLVMILLTVIPLVKGKTSRAQGISLLAIYAAFCAYQFVLG